jgi:putative endonuclease
MYYCYLLYSESLDRYYIGSTILPPEDRLENHLFEYYGKTKFTAKVKDWELFYFIECETKEQAIKIEKHLKRMKSKTYYKNLKKYPEITQRLMERYK